MKILILFQYLKVVRHKIRMYEYHLPAPSSAYMVTFLCLILQTTRHTTLQQKEDLMHTPSKIKISDYTHRFYLTWWWSADQLFLITENSCSVVVPNMQETTVRPPREAHEQSQVLHTITCVS